jgi:hypothetical protein
MLFTILLFFLSIAVAFALVARKIWQFRSRRLVPGSYEEADWHDLSIESVRIRLIELGKFGVHHFVLFALKVWIVVAYWFRKGDRKVKEGLTKVLHKNAHLPEGGKPSGFIKNMKQHKENVATAIQKEQD